MRVSTYVRSLVTFVEKAEWWVPGAEGGARKGGASLNGYAALVPQDEKNSGDGWRARSHNGVNALHASEP